MTPPTPAEALAAALVASYGHYGHEDAPGTALIRAEDVMKALAASGWQLTGPDGGRDGLAEMNAELKGYREGIAAARKVVGEQARTNPLDVLRATVRQLHAADGVTQHRIGSWTHCENRWCEQARAALASGEGRADHEHHWVRWGQFAARCDICGNPAKDPLASGEEGQ